MSVSGISFSGLGSGLDTESIISKLMQLENIPVQRMQTQQLQLQNKLDIYGTLQSKFTTLNSAIAALGTASAFNPIKAIIGDSTVASVTVGSAASTGTYALSVQQLATSHKVVSTSQTGSDTALNYTGDFMVNGKKVSVVATDTLNSIASKINGLKSGVTASIIGGSGSAYLSLTSTDTGASNSISTSDLTGGVLQSLGINGGADAYREPVTNGFRSTGFSSLTDTVQAMSGSNQSGSFTINGMTVNVDFSTDSLQTIANSINTAAGSTGVNASVVSVTQGSKTVQKLEVTGTISGLPTDPNGILHSLGVLQSGYTNQVIQAKDAAYTIDGIARTSATNIVSDAVAGATITLLKDASQGTATTTINLNRDTDQIKTAFKSYMDAFNGLVDFVKSASAFDAKTFDSGPLFGDIATTDAVASIQNALFKVVPGGGSFQSLADLGFGLDSDGKLTLDESKLQTALDTDADGVRKIMVSTGSSSNPDITFVSSTSSTQDPGLAGFQIEITKLGTKANTTANLAQTVANAGGEVLTFTGKSFPTDVQLTIPAGTTLSELVDQINADSRLKDYVVASVDSNGKLKIDADRYGSARDFQVSSNLAEAADNSGIGTTGGAYVKGEDIEGTINGEPAVGTGQYLVGKDTNSTSAGLQIQYTGTALGQVGVLNFTRGLSSIMTGSIFNVTDSGNGLLTATTKSVQSQIDDLTDQISSTQDRLTIREQTIRAKFLAMEQAMSTLQQQQAQLARMFSS